MNRGAWRSGLLGLALVASYLPAVAEVSTDILPGGQLQIVVLGSTEGPDPFGLSWRPYRDIPAFRILNPYGDSRGDGRPDIVLAPEGHYVVTWAWNNGTDHDIAVSEWTDSGWGSPVFLTGSALDELDPRLTSDDGILYLVWWTRQNQAIRFTTLPSGSGFWAAPSDLTPPGEIGRRPSVAVWDGQVHVAFERDPSQPELAQEIVVRVRGPAGVFTDTAVVRTGRTERLDPILHQENGWLWMDWKHGKDQFGYVINGGEGWSEPATLEWSDPSWVGVENVRQQIRQIVMALGAAPSLSAGKGERNGSPRQPAVVHHSVDSARRPGVAIVN